MLRKVAFLKIAFLKQLNITGGNIITEVMILNIDSLYIFHAYIINFTFYLIQIISTGECKLLSLKIGLSETFPFLVLYLCVNMWVEGNLLVLWESLILFWICFIQCYYP